MSKSGLLQDYGTRRRTGSRRWARAIAYCSWGLWWGIWLRLNQCRSVRLVWTKNGRSEWYGHDAKSLGLKELHGSSHVFFHQLSYLLLCAIIWPLIPGLLICCIFNALTLYKTLSKVNRWKNNNYNNTPDRKRPSTDWAICGLKLTGMSKYIEEQQEYSHLTTELKYHLSETFKYQWWSVCVPTLQLWKHQTIFSTQSTPCP